MALKVSCPNCLSLLQVPRKLRGKVVVCPCCKEKCRVPLPSTVGVSPAAVLVQQELAAEAHARPFDPTRGTWIRATVIASVAAAILAVGGLILSAAFDFGRDRRLLDAGQSAPADASGGGEDRSSPSASASSAELATQAEQVLRAHCYRCHGEEGADEGGFNFVLRRDRLVQGDRYVHPGEPENSRLLARITAGEMPPGGEQGPTKDDIETLRRWIAAGAPDFAAPLDRPFLSHAEMVRFIRRDLESEVPSRERQFTRYFTLVNLYNAGFSEDEMETYRLALSKLVNSLSWHKDVLPPHPIDPHKTIFRIDMRQLDWGSGIWQAIIDANPYSVRLNEDDVDGGFCLKATQCEIPYVRGDWFVAAASRPPLYHTVLQVPETLQELLAQRFPGVDLEKDIQQETVVRLGFGRSGVSTHNRLLEWHHSPHGYLWISYDFGGDVGRKNLFSHPLGPGKDEQQFDHDGGEIIFSLPNGLQGYMLVDGTGKRIDKGPLNIVSDPKRPDRAVTNGVSCMSCHYAGMISKSDEIRKTVEANGIIFRDSKEEILALYPPKKEIDDLFEKNARSFREAVNKVGIKDLTETGEPIVNMALRFEADVDARGAAAELGLKLESFLSQLGSNKNLQKSLGPLNVPGGTVKRDLFAKEFSSVVQLLGLGEPLNAPKVAKADGATSPGGDKAADGAKPPAEAKGPLLRVWSDLKNNVTIEAEFVNVADDKVDLRKVDGSPVQIPLAQLSPADRKFVDEQQQKAPQATLPPAENLADKLTNKLTDKAPPVAENPPKAAPQPPKPGPPAPPPPMLQYRAWRNVAINKEVQAAFISLVRGDIKLQERRFKGVVITWPMYDLSPEDHEYVKQIVGEDYYLLHK